MVITTLTCGIGRLEHVCECEIALPVVRSRYESRLRGALGLRTECYDKGGRLRGQEEWTQSRVYMLLGVRSLSSILSFE